jgi:hypothetical protein
LIYHVKIRKNHYNHNTGEVFQLSLENAGEKKLNLQLKKKRENEGDPSFDLKHTRKKEENNEGFPQKL